MGDTFLSNTGQSRRIYDKLSTIHSKRQLDDCIVHASEISNIVQMSYGMT